MRSASYVEEIKQQVEAEGYEPGTPQFEHRVLALKIVQCQQLRGLSSCGACSWREECQMAREFAELRHITNG